MTLANEGPGGFLTIPEISDREGLSSSHVAKLLSILRKSKFIKSIRGQAGGYVLASDPEDILIRDVLEALGGRLYGLGFCERHSGLLPSCLHESRCLVRPLWAQVQMAVDQAIEKVTLKDLISQSLDSSVPLEFRSVREFREKLTH